MISGSNAFFGVLEALRQDNLMKIMAEPTLVTISGRAASFNSGGEDPVSEPQSLGTVSIVEEVRHAARLRAHRVGQRENPPGRATRDQRTDSTHSLTINGTQCRALQDREAETGVEMQAGQTLAIAGLVQTVIEAENKGLPWISEVPYLGAAFRKVQERATKSNC